MLCEGLPHGSDDKKSACSMEDLGSIPALWGSTGEGNGYCSSILAWRIPWTEEPSKLQFTGWQRVRHNWMTNTHTHTHTCYVNYISIKPFKKIIKLFENYCQWWKFLYLLPLSFFLFHLSHLVIATFEERFINELIINNRKIYDFWMK